MGTHNKCLYKENQIKIKLHRKVDAIQMGTHNICLYKEVDKKYIGCNLKTTKLYDCALIGVCAVIRSNTVFVFPLNAQIFTYIQAGMLKIILFLLFSNQQH